jgi:hypothetical protein
MDRVSLLVRIAIAVLGLLLIIAGLAMTATIVMLPFGLLTFLVGVLTFVGAMYADIDRRPDDATKEKRAQ